MKDISIIRVAGSDALAELERLRRDHKTSGLYPILFGNEEEYERVQEICESNATRGQTPATILHESEVLAANEWVEGRIADFADVDDRLTEEPWPDDPTEELGIITQNDILTGEPKPEVLIGLLPVDQPWKVFAELMWGGWNDCPFPSEHCAIHRHWEKQYGAEVVSITADVVQCILTKPPTSQTAARRLAREQYAYCCEIVEQGTGTVTNLAAGLLDSPYWYFWWD